MDSQTDLKPCPLCGRPPSKIALSYHWKGISWRKLEYEEIGCEYCNLTVKCDFDDAKKIWNRRENMWHPADKPPEDSCWVLVRYSDDSAIPDVAHYDARKGHEGFYHSYIGMLDGVRFWMRLCDLAEGRNPRWDM